MKKTRRKSLPNPGKLRDSGVGATWGGFQAPECGGRYNSFRGIGYGVKSLWGKRLSLF